MDRNAQPDIHRTEQGVLNRSFDETYQVLAVEMLVHNPDTGTLDRMKQPGASTAYQSRFDDTTESGNVFLGKALPGTAVSDAGWQIKKVDGTSKSTTFADDETSFTKIWADRATYNY